MPGFDHDSLRFHYRERGEGFPFIFQHGLGGDLNQPFSLYQPPAGIRLLGFDARGHGQTHPLGDVDQLSIATLADDLIAFLDHLGIDRGVIGGISLGSAVAVNVALRFPERVRGLVLSRPAWIDGPVPENVRLYAMIARLIRELGAAEGLERFLRTPEFQAMERESPDCARSLIGQFEQPRAEECVARLERLAGDSPCGDRGDYRRIAVPALVLGNRQDPIHPWAIAETIAQLIPGAELRALTPKSVSLEAHTADVQQALDAFFQNRFREEVTPC
ncbi:MAG TPA: alpha/beta fold hydrolase [Isosphaeraceae bacterium]|nr:alpha/beta fold hydrolase [Isosphaeraceae bacterium]